MAGITKGKRVGSHNVGKKTRKVKGPSIGSFKKGKDNGNLAAMPTNGAGAV